MRLLTVLLFGVFLVATQVFLVLKAMQDNLFERNVDPVDAVMERQASISDELTPQERLWLSKNHTVSFSFSSWMIFASSFSRCSDT